MTAEISSKYAPFALMRAPRFGKLTVSLPRPSTLVVTLAIFASYFFVTSGAIYDMINEPPAMGMEPDPVTGKQKPVAIMRGKLSSQYIMEGLLGGFVYLGGALGFIFLHLAHSKTASTWGWPANRLILIGAVVLSLCFVVLLALMNMKMPGYM